jgi:hypothetical protein
MSEVRPSEPHRHGLVVPVRMDPTGKTGPTRGQAQGPGWRRTSHGFFVPSQVDADDVEQRIVEASVVVPEGLGITGWAGLRWLGGRWFEGTTAAGDRRPVTIAISTYDIRSQPAYGIAISGEGLWRRMAIVHDGLRITQAVWSVSFEMRYAESWRRAVVALDMAAYNDLVSLEEQTEFLSHQNGWTGIPQARKALQFADENSWSPAETLMRLTWVIDAELPPPLCNQPVFDLHGRHLGTPDLLDVETGLMGEYDGPDHLQRAQRARDIQRAGLLHAHDLESVTMVAEDFRDLDGYLRRLRDARRRAQRNSAHPRTWTIEPPWWWTPTVTVAQRRALTLEQRLRFLKHRSA